MGDEHRDLSLLDYRVGLIETKVSNNLTEINDKLDAILVQLSTYETSLAIESEKRQQLERRVEMVEARMENMMPAGICKAHKSSVDKDLTALSSKVKDMQGDVSKLQISTAEKLGPGAIAGAVVAGLFLIIKIFLGV